MSTTTTMKIKSSPTKGPLIFIVIFITLIQKATNQNTPSFLDLVEFTFYHLSSKTVFTSVISKEMEISVTI